MDEPVEGLDQVTPETTAAVVAASKAPRRPATFQDLLAKKAREADVVVKTTDDDGEEVELVLRYRAISGPAYDKLVEAHEPSKKDKDNGAVWNPDTFQPALVSAVCIDPQLSFDEAKSIFDDPKWSGGETSSLFMAALRICNSGLDVPFTVAG